MTTRSRLVLCLRMGGGVEYFLTSRVATGVQLAWDVGSSMGERPAFYSTAEWLLFMSYAVD